MDFIEETKNFKFWNVELRWLFVPFSEKVTCKENNISNNKVIEKTLGILLAVEMNANIGLLQFQNYSFKVE